MSNQAEAPRDLQEQYVDNSPNAALLTQALRSLGYDNLSAICDILDNSIDAEATEIKIFADKAEDGPRIIIADNGYGMDRDTLDQALRLGSDVDHDISSELGKFGMGLCTASMSIGKRVEVITTTEEAEDIYSSASDVDDIIRTNRFVKTLGRAIQDEVNVFYGVLGDEAVSGTIVMLSKCDNIKNVYLTTFANAIQNEVSRVFRLFIQSGIKFYVNGVLCKVDDPLHIEEKGTEIFSDDNYPIKVKTKEGKEILENIRVRLAILPDFGAEGNKLRKINYEHQGFYVMRNNREVLAGKSLGFFTKHPALNRFRAELYFNASLDEAMGVNFTKSRVLDIHQSVRDKLNDYLRNQINTIRRRVEKTVVARESSDVSHSESERVITQKAKLLLTPKPEKEVRHRDPDAKKKGKDPKEDKQGRGPREKLKDTQEARGDVRVRFEAEHGGRTGHIYESYLEGRTIIIRWNIDHPFYERFVVMNKDNKTMASSVDFLVYSLATAELSTGNEETWQTIENIKTIMSQNLRTLLD